MTRTTFWDGDVFSNLSNTVSYILIVLAHWHNNPHDAPPRHDPNSESYNLCSYSRSNNICTCTNFIVYGLTWLGVEPTACHARDGCYFEKDKVLLRHTCNILTNQSTRNPRQKNSKVLPPHLPLTSYLNDNTCFGYFPCCLKQM